MGNGSHMDPTRPAQARSSSCRFRTSRRRNGKCLAGEECTEDTYEEERPESWHDPAPALVVQDELHLLREELGAFDAHYEGLFAELQQTGPSGLPSKILAASARTDCRNFRIVKRDVSDRCASDPKHTASATIASSCQSVVHSR